MGGVCALRSMEEMAVAKDALPESRFVRARVWSCGELTPNGVYCSRRVLDLCMQGTFVAQPPARIKGMTSIARRVSLTSNDTVLANGTAPRPLSASSTHSTDSTDTSTPSSSVVLGQSLVRRNPSVGVPVAIQEEQVVQPGASSTDGSALGTKPAASNPRSAFGHMRVLFAPKALSAEEFARLRKTNADPDAARQGLESVMGQKRSQAAPVSRAQGASAVAAAAAQLEKSADGLGKVFAASEHDFARAPSVRQSVRKRISSGV